VKDAIQRAGVWWQEDERGWKRWNAEREKWEPSDQPPPPPVVELSKKRRNFKRWWIIANVLLVLGVLGSAMNLAIALEACDTNEFYREICRAEAQAEHNGSRVGSGLLLVGNAIAWGVWRSRFKS
jgi:hypothetical protein